MSSTYLFALSFQRLTGVPSSGEHYALDDLSRPCPGLELMTNTFGISFRAVFSAATVFHLLPRDGAVRARASQGPVLRALLLLSSSTDRLDGVEGGDYLLVALVDLPAQSPPPIDVKDKLELLRRLGQGQVLERLSSAPGFVVGQNGWLIDRVDDAEVPSLTLVFGFYVYAWLLLIRIERTQMTISLSKSRRPIQVSGHEIARQRLRLLNVDRYFLTSHRTNNAVLKAHCDDLRLKLMLFERFNHLSATHREFEQYLDNVSKLTQSEQLGSVSNLLLLLTILSVPIAFFAAVIAIDPDGGFFKAPLRVAQDLRVYALLALGFFLVAIPFGLMRLLDLVRGLIGGRRGP